jgi:O-antigen/teichoic acid export membrane protein
MSESLLEIQRHGMMHLIASAGITFIGFFATIFYANWVGAAVLGVYFLFLSYFNILGSVIDFGISYAGTQRICEGKDPDSYYSASFALCLGIFLLIAIGLVIFQDYSAKLNGGDCCGFWLPLSALPLSDRLSVWR